jgi:serine protease inhibitor
MKHIILPILIAAALPAVDFRITPAMNAFTTEPYKRLTGGVGNLILSPFNVAIALSMLLAGARGWTAEEIQSVLRLHYAALGNLTKEMQVDMNGKRRPAGLGNNPALLKQR